MMDRAGPIKEVELSMSGLEADHILVVLFTGKMTVLVTLCEAMERALLQKVNRGTIKRF